MTYPNHALFDIETLINEAQPRSILLLGDVSSDLLNCYVEQKALLQQACTLTHFNSAQVDQVISLEERFDVAVAINLFEHIPKQTGVRLLSRLRDVLTPQYCICLPLANSTADNDQSAPTWQLTELFSFALKKVNEYQTEHGQLGLFKYNIDDYKSTPDWLNPNNWANPNMWDKYRW
ncbi:DUF6231 family protein [Arenicella xantha]|uniref:Methyltransferase family protein n=1 Tax=Arenicella xantha TaxID=644221 RepID=A0A395JN69_9GAMM|nr:DUF6231 family protein [Arenicella xantha]RBP52733.1 hypothetical protein DFR28_101115 [Arenicella xantha]